MITAKPRKNCTVHHRTDFLDLPLLPSSIPAQSTFDFPFVGPRSLMGRYLARNALLGENLAHSSSAYITVCPDPLSGIQPPAAAILDRGLDF
jgi:hypothetical protein